MIPYQQALELIKSHADKTRMETIPLSGALGKTAAEKICSPIDVPSFRNSAMDGYAVCSSALSSASEASPVRLTVEGTIAAGDAAPISDKDSVAVQIMTGAPVPEPFDAVVPVELVKTEGNQVTFIRSAKAKDNIRFPGEDVSKGQNILAVGDRITAEKIMLLAALGIGGVKVRGVPHIHIISTGNEITDNLETPLPEGMIYNSNAPYLMACARSQGFNAYYEGIIQDNAKAFEKRISDLKEPAIIISTGAVSKGSRDFIPGSLQKLGASIHFHRVNIRPGKPILFATLPNGNFYFGLPGNPISAAIGWTFFVMPLIHKLQGLDMPQPISARLVEGFTKKGDFRQFLKSQLMVTGEGRLSAQIASGQESFKIRPLAESNAWVMLDESKTVWNVGEIVPVFPYGAWSVNNPLANEGKVWQAA